MLMLKSHVEVSIESASGLGEVELPLEFLDALYPDLYTKVFKKNK